MHPEDNNSLSEKQPQEVTDLANHGKKVAEHRGPAIAKEIRRLLEKHPKQEKPKDPPQK